MNFKQLLLSLAFIYAANSQILSSIPNIFSPLSYCLPSSNCCDTNTISAHGSATIQATPDTATLQASISINADTAALAIRQLSAAVARIVAILKNNGLTEDNYQTSSFSIYPNTSYSDGQSSVVGQIATQSFQITIPSIARDGSNISRLIDSLAAVNGIVLNGLSFDVSNKTALYQQLRQQAYQNAQSKAQDYSVALQLCLGQLLSLTDSLSIAPVVSAAEPMLIGKASNSLAPTAVNVGTIPLSYDLDAIFAFN